MSKDTLGLDRIRVQIMRQFPFFGSLLHTVTIKESTSVPTAGIDGDNEILVNPNFYSPLTEEEKIFLICHEVLHAALLHYDRLMEQDTDQEKMLANIAEDYLVNFMAKACGLTLIKDAFYNGDYTPEKYTMEQLMNLLRKDKNTMKQIQQQMAANYGHGNGRKEGSGMGRGNDILTSKKAPSTPTEKRKREQEMQMALSSAVTIAKKRGDLPACIERFVADMIKPKTNWKAELYDWFNVKVKDETSWNRPNRRFVYQRKIFPSKYSVGCGHIGVAIDVSGSIGQHELNVFASELNYIFEVCKPSKVTVVYFDTSVKAVDEFEEFPIKLKTVGGGGTVFSCAFNHFNNLRENLTGLVFMTDMYGDWPDEPAYPVCVLSTTENMKAPFGRIIYANMKDR